MSWNIGAGGKVHGREGGEAEGQEFDRRGRIEPPDLGVLDRDLGGGWCGSAKGCDGVRVELDQRKASSLRGRDQRGPRERSVLLAEREGDEDGGAGLNDESSEGESKANAHGERSEPAYLPGVGDGIVEYASHETEHHGSGLAAGWVRFNHR